MKTKMDIEKKRNIEERQTERTEGKREREKGGEKERERKVREEKWSR